MTAAAGGTEIGIDEVQADAVLDTVGLYCPVPIIRTAEAMKAMRRDGILEILSDDRVILIDMPAWCRSTGNVYLGSRQEGFEYHLYVRKGASLAGGGSAEPSGPAEPAAGRKR